MKLPTRWGAAWRATANLRSRGVAGMEHAARRTAHVSRQSQVRAQGEDTPGPAPFWLPKPLKGVAIACLVSANPYLDFARALALFYQPPAPAPGIHPTGLRRAHRDARRELLHRALCGGGRARAHRPQRGAASARGDLRRRGDRRRFSGAFARRGARVLPHRQPRDPAERRGGGRRRLRLRQARRRHALQDRAIGRHGDRRRCGDAVPDLGRPRHGGRNARQARRQDRQPGAGGPRLRGGRGQHHLRADRPGGQHGAGAQRAAGRTGGIFRAPDDSRRRDRLRAERHRRRRGGRRADLRLAGVRGQRMAARHHRVPQAAGAAQDRAGIEEESRCNWSRMSNDNTTA